MLQFQHHLFLRALLSQMTSRAEHYDVIYHPFPIISKQSDLATERERQLMTARAD